MTSTKDAITMLENYISTAPPGDFVSQCGLVSVELYYKPDTEENTDYSDFVNCDNIELTIFFEQYHQPYEFKYNIDIYKHRIIFTSKPKFMEGISTKTYYMETKYFQNLSAEELFQYSTLEELPPFLTEEEIFRLLKIAQTLPEYGYES